MVRLFALTLGTGGLSFRTCVNLLLEAHLLRPLCTRKHSAEFSVAVISSSEAMYPKRTCPGFGTGFHGGKYTPSLSVPGVDDHCTFVTREDFELGAKSRLLRLAGKPWLIRLGQGRRRF